MVNKNKFINSSFIVLEHDFPFSSLLLLLHCRLFNPAKKLFSLCCCLILLLFDLFGIYCLQLPKSNNKLRTESKVKAWKEMKGKKSICCPIKPSVCCSPPPLCDGEHLPRFLFERRESRDRVSRLFHTFVVTFNKYVVDPLLLLSPCLSNVMYSLHHFG